MPTEIKKKLAKGSLPWVSKMLLTIAVMVIGLVGSGVGVTIASYTNGLERMQSQAVNVVEDITDATMLWRTSWETVDLSQFGVQYFVPLSEDAPLPTGLTSWPKPGTMMLSPSLAGDPSAQKNLERFGEFAGVIPAEVLTSPNGKALFVFPDQERIDTEKFLPANGFNGMYVPFSEALSYQPMWMFLAALIILGGSGAFALLISASKFADSKYRINQKILFLIGTPRVDRMKLAFRRVAAPFGIGALLAVAATATTAFIPVTIPMTGYLISQEDVRSSFLNISLYLALALVLSLVVLLFESVRTRTVRRKSSRFSNAGANPILALGFLIALNAMYFGFKYLMDHRMYEVITPLFVISVAVLLLLLPAFMTFAAKYVGTATSWIGHRLGKPQWIVGGRQLQSSPVESTRTMAALTLTLVFITQIQLWTNTVSANRDALDEYYAFKDHLMVSSSVELTHAQLGDELSKINIPWASVIIDVDRNYAKVHAPDAVLAELGLTKTDQNNPISVDQIELSYFRELLQGEAVPSVFGTSNFELPNDDEPSIFVAFSKENEVIDSAEVLALATTLQAPRIDIDPYGESWAGGSATSTKQAIWVSLFGSFGAALLLTSVLLSAASAALRNNEDIGPLSAIASPPKVASQAAAIRITIPAIVGLAITLPVVIVTGMPHIDVRAGQTLPWVLIITTVVLASVAQLFIVRYIGTQSRLALTRWRPGNAELADHL